MPRTAGAPSLPWSRLQQPHDTAPVPPRRCPVPVGTACGGRLSPERGYIGTTAFPTVWRHGQRAGSSKRTAPSAEGLLPSFYYSHNFGGVPLLFQAQVPCQHGLYARAPRAHCGLWAGQASRLRLARCALRIAPPTKGAGGAPASAPPGGVGIEFGSTTPIRSFDNEANGDC